MAVTFDAAGPIGGTVVGAPSSISWAHVCSGSLRLLIVTAVMSQNPDTGHVLTVTYNGVAMTSVRGPLNSGGISGKGFIEMFYLIDPALGSNTVLVSMTGNVTGVFLAGGSASYNGVNHASCIRNVNTNYATAGTNPSVVISSAVGNMVSAGECNGTSRPVATQTLNWSVSATSATWAGNSLQEDAAGAASVTMGTTTTTDAWAMIGFDIVSALPSNIMPITDFIWAGGEE